MLERRAVTHRRGSTLLEALLVLSLGSILAGVGVARLGELVQSARLAGTTRSLATVLRLARGRAIAGGVPVEVRFEPLTGHWTVRRAGEVLETHALPPRVAFGALPARQRILFGALGTADNATVTLAAGERRRSVVVNQRGRVRLP